MDTDAYADSVFTLLKDSPSETVSIRAIYEWIKLYLFVQNVDKTFYNKVISFPITKDANEAEFKKGLVYIIDETAKHKAGFASATVAAAGGAPAPVLDPMEDLVGGDLPVIFNKINIVDGATTKNNIKTLINNDRADSAIDNTMSIADENEFVSLVNRIRAEIAAGAALPPLLPGPVVVTPVTPAVITPKMYTFYAYEKDNNSIDIFAENTNDALMNNVLKNNGANFIKIPNMNPRIEAIAETLLHKDTILKQPIQFKTPDDIRSMPNTYSGRQDAVLGTGWTNFFRSPVFLTNDMTGRAPVGETTIPIYYYDRKPASIDSAGNVKLYKNAHTTNTEAGPSSLISEIARLDTFVENMNKISKMELTDGDPVYLISIEQTPVLKSIMSTQNQCQYLNIKIEKTLYSSTQPSHKWGIKSSNSCSSTLPSGALYASRFDDLVNNYLVGPATPAPSGPLAPVAGGSMNKYTRKFTEPVMYHTRHRRHRITRANMKRKRYNKTRKG